MQSDEGRSPRYRAFISYSHADARVAQWLHRSIEHFSVPTRLTGAPGPEGPVPRRLLPVFIDRGELAASGNLSTELEAALADSRFLVVVCTPSTPKSVWVDEEIKRFKMRFGEHRVLAMIAAGTPGASEIKGREAEECFPPSLRFAIGADGERTADLAEPLAADLRPEGDGRRLALLKLIATLAGTRLDDLVQREATRRIRRMTGVAVGSVLGMVITGGLAVYASQQRHQAEREAVTANTAIEFLVGIFDIVDTGNENPQTVTAETLLKRSAGKAETSLDDQPQIRARIAYTIGRVYNNLGLYKDSAATLAKARPLLTSLGSEGAPGLITLARAQLHLGDLKSAATTLTQVRVKFQMSRPPSRVEADAAQLAGRIATAEGDQNRAIAEYLKAEALYRSSPDAKAEEIADILTDRGVLLTDMARFDEAETALKASNAIYRRSLGDYHRRTGISYNALAYNEYSAKRYAEATVNISKAEAIFRRVLDANNPTFAGALSLRGQIEQQSGHPERAADPLRQAIAIYHARFGTYHYLIGLSLVSLALVEADLGRYAPAMHDFDAAKLNYDVGYGHIHANHGDLLVNRATVFARMGRNLEASRDCAAGMSILRRTLGAEAGYTLEMAKTCENLPGPAVKLRKQNHTI